MVTDPVPRKASDREEFVRSDRLAALLVPTNDRLKAIADRIEAAMKTEARGDIKNACAAFLTVASSFYKVREPGISVLAARPLRVREGGWRTEIFGDYAPDRMFMRVWMRTAVQKRVTSFGTFSAPCATNSATTWICSGSGSRSLRTRAGSTQGRRFSITTRAGRRCGRWFGGACRAGGG